MLKRGSIFLWLTVGAVAIWRAMGQTGQLHCVYDFCEPLRPSTPPQRRPRNQRNNPSKSE